MKAKVTTEIDEYLKQAFEITKEVHGITYRELIEKGIAEILMKVNPIDLLDHDIKRVDLEQENRRQLISRMKMLEKLHPQEKEPEIDHQIEETREQLFQKNISYFTRLYESGKLYCSANQGGPNWDYILHAYSFKDRNHAEKWLNERILKDKR